MNNTIIHRRKSTGRKVRVEREKKSKKFKETKLTYLAQPRGSCQILLEPLQGNMVMEQECAVIAATAATGGDRRGTGGRVGGNAGQMISGWWIGIHGWEEK